MKLTKRLLAYTLAITVTAGMIGGTASVSAEKKIPNALNEQFGGISTIDNHMIKVIVEENDTIDDVVSALHNSDVDYYDRENMKTYYDYWIKRDSLASNKNHIVEDADKLPSKYDLRDVDGKCYVSPVKTQSPWSTCWSFGAIAAAETSIAHSFGIDYNVTDDPRLKLFDLSEKHLAWFMYDPISTDSKRCGSQAGEGMYSIKYDPNADNADNSFAVYSIGGYMSPATTLFSAGIGPALELEYPYEGKDRELYPKEVMFISLDVDDNGMLDTSSQKQLDSLKMTDEELKEAIKKYESEGYIYYDYDSALELLAKGDPKISGKTILTASINLSNGDWTLDEKERFSSSFSLIDGNALPTPAGAGKNGEYIYNSVATDAIKNEIVNGRAVTIGFEADQSVPGQQLGDESFMNFVYTDEGSKKNSVTADIWAHYTYDMSYDPSDPKSINHKVFDYSHAVCIVGYDDDFPKEYFNDPKGTIGGNGAWLVKNSWGSIENGTADEHTAWGNSGTGYFWLSYYDQSIEIPESFSFESSEESLTTQTKIDMYDYMPVIERDEVKFDSDVYMANKFTADNNCNVRFIGIETVDADTTVKYSVYVLNDDAQTPTDGHLMAESEETFPYAGYHKIDLGRVLPLAKGYSYSIVAQAVSKGTNAVFFNHAETLEGYNAYYDSRKARHVDHGKSADHFVPMDRNYSVGVVNKGESFVGIKGAEGTQWADWADVTSELKSINAAENMDYFTYDNFPIRSYPETELITATNIVIDKKDTYSEGDIIKGVVHIENNSDKDFAADSEIELVVDLTEIGKNNSKVKFKGLKAGEEHTVEYTYTVTKADVKAGKIVSNMIVLINGEEIDYDPVFGDILSFTVNTAPEAVTTAVSTTAVTTSTTTVSTTVSTTVTEPLKIKGDANGDGILNVRDAAFIARMLAQGKADELPENADFNGDGKVNVRDAVAIAAALAKRGVYRQNARTRQSR